MIVLIDAAKQEVTVATVAGLKTFNMADTDAISYEISGRPVYYVTAAQEVEGNDVLSLLQQTTGLEYAPVEKTGRLFLRSTARGKLVVRAHGDEEDLVFDSPIDFKALSGFPGDPDVIFPDLSELKRRGRIEVVDESELTRIRSEYNSNAKKPVSTREKELDKMIVSGSVEDRLAKISDGEENEDVITMEISQRDLTSNRTMNSEVMENMRSAGVNLSDEDVG